MRLFKRGDYILGEVFDTSQSVIFITINKTTNKNIIRNSLFGILHISDIDNRFIENIKNEYRIGDIVKLKVKELNKWGVNLSSKDKKAGVILGFCSKCRNPLIKEDNHLKCNVCGNIETRKISIDYGKVEEYYGDFKEGR